MIMILDVKDARIPTQELIFLLNSIVAFWVLKIWVTLKVHSVVCSSDCYIRIPLLRAIELTL